MFKGIRIIQEKCSNSMENTAMKRVPNTYVDFPQKQKTQRGNWQDKPIEEGW